MEHTPGFIILTGSTDDTRYHLNVKHIIAYCVRLGHDYTAVRTLVSTMFVVETPEQIGRMIAKMSA